MPDPASFLCVELIVGRILEACELRLAMDVFGDTDPRKMPEFFFWGARSIDFDTDFYYAEPYHQQYLAKNPNGDCGIKGTGVSCPIGLSS